MRRGTITVTWVPGDPAEPPRVAYAVGRRAGGAVVRNRIRRRLRAVIRDLSSELAPGSYLVGAGGQAASLSYGELRATVSEALRAVVR
ncbi:MAG: ribonuclease P protein component [Actinomycetota bacterium]|nr:ribonuclease P protein component [Actinomycetota bacterium]